MEDQEFLKEIFQRYLQSECSSEEVRFLLKHFSSNDNEEALRKIIAEKLTEYSLYETKSVRKSVASFDHTFKEILKKIENEDSIVEEDNNKKETYGQIAVKVTALLTLLLIMVGGVVFYNHPANKVEREQLVKSRPKQNIKPGSNKAILTLQDGSTIVLNDAKNGTLAKQGNTSVVKLANGGVMYNETSAPTNKVLCNTMTTPRGGRYKLTLPDGTDVWLNSASSITYPTAFVGKERKVTITGEAYFEVAKDKTKPFFVQSGNQKIEVLGTHFNVMAYADEQLMKTTLLEGSVKITARDKISILKPGEQAILSKEGVVEIKPAVIEEAIAWKNGYFKFNRVDIKYIMRQLSRWYDVDVVYDGNMPADEFVGKIGRSENITQVLRLLELEHVHFKIEGKKITVLP